MLFAIQLAEKGLISDSLIRIGIRKLLRERIHQIEHDALSSQAWITRLEDTPLAEAAADANRQHYEIPPEYFETVLGKHLKYSAAFWPDGCDCLDTAEATMLRLTCERAAIADGQKILELGCGWGSLSLWMAAHYPHSEIHAISNSTSQRVHIEAQCRARGLKNLSVRTVDINNFDPGEPFDRIVSVEMFEHVRNHRRLIRRIHDWLRPGGKLFVHIFSHSRQTYLFDARSNKDWMSQYFFTGGIMPSVDLLPTAAAGILNEEARWLVNGCHYSRTLEAWLEKQDAKRDQVLRIFEDCYGSENARLWFQRWRIFYMACAELFAFDRGKEWPVTHYRFSKSEHPA